MNHLSALLSTVSFLVLFIIVNEIIYFVYYKFITDLFSKILLKPSAHSITPRILRVICSCCGHTHAILPDPIIPYDSYSLFFILRALADYFLHSGTISSICDRFCITPMQLYRWKALYQDHRREWQGLLRSVEQDLLHSLKELVHLDPFSSFTKDFFQKTSMSFMQSHKNPASSLRNLSPP